MAAPLALAVYTVVLAGAAALVWRRPARALWCWLVGLAAHNSVLAALYTAGVRGGALTAIQAWKELLLAVAVARVVTDGWRTRRLPFRPRLADWLAIAFGALVVVYALIPQSSLGGLASHKTILYGLRHDGVPVVVYLLFRSLRIGVDELRRLLWVLVGSAATVALVGIVDDYALSIGWWRGNGVVAYFHRQLGYDYHGTGGLPENFIYNTGSEAHFLRRLVSFFLSPLASAYLFVVALLAAAAALRHRLVVPLAALVFAGLLFTFSRSSLLALAGGLCVLAFAQLRWWPVALAVLVVAVSIGWVHVFPQIAPQGHWTKADLVYQRGHATSGASGSPTSVNEPSLASHWRSLKDGLRTVFSHPQGYGLGNAGQVASRTGTKLRAGESNYTEIGVGTGLLGMLLWAAWGVAALIALLRAARSGAPELRPAAGAWAAAFAAILALAIQTDVIGDPWVAYVAWALAGGLAWGAPDRAAVPAASRRARREAPRAAQTVYR